jgi:hypothetical protein
MLIWWLLISFYNVPQFSFVWYFPRLDGDYAFSTRVLPRDVPSSMYHIWRNMLMHLLTDNELTGVRKVSSLFFLFLLFFYFSLPFLFLPFPSLHFSLQIRILLFRPGWLGTHYVAQAGLKLTILLPQSLVWVLHLQECTTTSEFFILSTFVNRNSSVSKSYFFSPVHLWTV